MANSISQKLRIKEKFTLLTLNAPADFKKGLTELPTGVKIITIGKDYDQVHWFVLNKAQLKKEMSKVMHLVITFTRCNNFYSRWQFCQSFFEISRSIQCKQGVIFFDAELLGNGVCHN